MGLDLGSVRARRWVPVVAAVGTALAAACAREEAPSGGPADRRPPVIVGVRPDTFALVEPGNERIRIEFDESLSENPSSGTLDQAVDVSPRTGEVTVHHEGDAVEVEIEGGFQPGVVYRVTVKPVIQDRFRNAMLDPFEWVFSTGPDFTPNALAGEVWDRTTGDPVTDLPVFAVTPDSVLYSATTDSAGVFVMRYLPSGPYQLVGFDDRNANDLADPFEVQGVGETLVLSGADTLVTDFWVMLPDTTGPQLAQGEKIDSATVRLVFDDPLDPMQSLVGLVRGMYRDPGNTPGVLEALHPWQYRLRLEAEAEAAAAAAEQEAQAAPVESPPAADTGAAAVDPTLDPAVDPAQAGAVPRPAAGPRQQAPQREFLPNGERVPENEIILILRGPIEGGSIYTVVHGPLANVAGVITEEGEGDIRLPDDPEPPPVAADTTDTATADTAVVVAPPDTLGVGR